MEPLLLDAVPTPLAIMDAPCQIDLAEELNDVTKKLSTMNSVLSTIKSKLTEVSNSLGVKVGAVEPRATILLKISEPGGTPADAYRSAGDYYLLEFQRFRWGFAGVSLGFRCPLDLGSLERPTGRGSGHWS